MSSAFAVTTATLTAVDAGAAMRVDQALAEGAATLAEGDGRREATLLLANAMQRDRAWLLAHDDDVVPDTMLTCYRDWLRQRAAGIPVAYLLGRREFWSMPLRVSPAVLIPRADTECLVELALERMPPDTPLRVADLGTGSGAIALAIARERPQAHVLATDASSDALIVARDNSIDLGLAERVRLRKGDWLEALQGEAPFDIIVSNPPYIAAADPHLAQGDLRHEPPGALASGPDGLDAIRIIVAGAHAHLVAGGWLLLEHGHDQAEGVREQMARAGYSDIASHRDLGDNDRVTCGRHPP